MYRLLQPDELQRTLEFCSNSWERARPELRGSLLKKIGWYLSNGNAEGQLSSNGKEDVYFSMETKHFMTGEEQRLLAYLKSRRLPRTEDTMNIKNLSADIVRGRKPRLQRGQLGLVLVEK